MGMKYIPKRVMNYGTKEHRNTSSQTINLVQMETQRPETLTIRMEGKYRDGINWIHLDRAS